MSLGWSKNSNIYSNFQDGVQKQLDERKRIVSKKTGRTDLDLTYLNSTTGWVKLSSGVDQLKVGKDGKEIRSNLDARENVLFGGSFNDSTKKVRSGLDTSGKNKKSSYGFSEQYGFRPMAGITAAQIKTQGTFGAIKRATIEFQVNSLEDLEKFEKLYMLPGYSVLLEWGHSMILGNDGKIDTLIKTYDRWFVNLPSHDEENESHRTAVMLGELEALRRNQDFNYDVLLGKVTNYVWSLNPEGTYSCQVDITGYGELAESLSALFSPKRNKTEEELKSGKFNKFGIYLETILDFIPTFALPKTVEDVPVTNFIIESGKTSGIFSATTLDELQKTIGNYVILNLSNSKNIDGGTDASISKYIALGRLLHLINESFMPKEDNKKWIKFYVGKHNPSERMPFGGAGAFLDQRQGVSEYENISPFNTFDDHISANMDVCFLPKLKNEERKIRLYFAEQDEVTNKRTGILRGDTNDILNIAVNVNYVNQLFDEYIKKPNNEDINIYDLVKDLLSAIAKSLGNINNFSLEARDQIYYINDRGVTPPKSDIDYTLDLFGIKGLTTNVSLQSSIPSSLSTLIAIGASAAGNTLNENIFNFQSFYRDFKDRIIPTRDTGAGNEEQSETDRANDAARIVGRYIRSVNSKFTISNISTHDLIPAHQTLTNLLFKKSLLEADSNAPGVIPIQLSFEMKGISGLRITDVFNVAPGLLPSRYKNNISFTITGIDNQIVSNQWTTTVSALMMSTTPMKEVYVGDEINIDTIQEALEEVYPDEILQEGFPNATRVREHIATTNGLFEEKGTELTSSGRDITSNAATLAIALMNNIKKERNKLDDGFSTRNSTARSLKFRWTGGNDSFHVFNPDPPKSTKHRTGQGLDLAIQQTYTAKQLNLATDIVTKASLTSKSRINHSFKDEYKDASGHATGGHWHFGVGSGGSDFTNTEEPLETKEVSLDELSSNATNIGFQ